jgi:hypothetical protein
MYRIHKLSDLIVPPTHDRRLELNQSVSLTKVAGFRGLAGMLAAAEPAYPALPRM